MTKAIRLKNLDCANCALKLERALSKVNGVKSASVNFIYQKMFIEYDESVEGVMQEIKAVAKKTLPDVEVIGI